MRESLIAKILIALEELISITDNAAERFSYRAALRLIRRASRK